MLDLQAGVLRGPDPYLHDDHFHLHVGREGQVGLEVLGQGHEEVQGGQQVLANAWEKVGPQSGLPGYRGAGATRWAPYCHNHPLPSKSLASGVRRKSTFRTKEIVTLLQSSFLQI